MIRQLALPLKQQETEEIVAAYCCLCDNPPAMLRGLSPLPGGGGGAPRSAPHTLPWDVFALSSWVLGSFSSSAGIWIKKKKKYDTNEWLTF